MAMYGNVITVSYVAPQRPDSPFDFRECVFSVCELASYDGCPPYEVTCSLPLCEDGMKDVRAACDGGYRCRDMKEEFRPYMSGKDVGQWYLKGDLSRKFADLLNNSSTPLLFDDVRAVIDYGHEGREWFRVTINVPYMGKIPRSIAWSGTYEWTGRLTGKWKALQDLADFVIESHKQCASDLQVTEMAYESSAEEKVDEFRRSEERRRERRTKLLGMGIVLMFLALAIAVVVIFSA